MYEAKIFGTVELKSDGGGGAFTATFSTFGVVDHDGDVTLPGAIPHGQNILIGAYNHSSVTAAALPVGIGKVNSDARRAWVDATFLDTPAGRAHYNTLKQLGPLTEWSYTFKIQDASREYSELQAWPGAKRILKALDVIEVSPVIRGAGIATRTDSMKEDLVALDELLDENAQRLMGGGDDEIYRIWEQLEAERQRGLLDLRFI